jgi:feruloyl esterase
MRSSGRFRAFIQSGMTLAAVLIGNAVDAQNADSFLDAERSSVRYRDTPFNGSLECGDFVSRTSAEFSVLTAQLEQGDTQTPDHCRIIGVIPAEIIFEVNLPLAWNGRFYMYGNGGFAGQPPSAQAEVRNQALRHGFATAYTNTGHDAAREPGATFAYNNLQKTVDYLFRAVHLTVTYAKELVADYYGRETDYSYWDGCSMGGRQGMLSAQRFPEDFDGIVAGAPALDFTGTMLSYAWQSRAMQETTLRPDAMRLLAERVYEHCDARDGLRDGLIDDPRRCDFDPVLHLPRCSDGVSRADCFAPEEIGVLEKLYAGPRREGRNLHPGVLPGTEALGLVRSPDGTERRSRGWEPWILRSDGPSFQRLMVESYLKYLAFEADDPDYELHQFPIETEPQGLDPLTLELLDAKETDMTRFRQRGGKMITYFGWADAAINPLSMIDYYESLEVAMGRRPHDFYRLYMVPGMFHCDGGVGADDVDFMTAIIEWVEDGREPHAIVGRHTESGEVKFSRPQCPYPQVARYTGTGPTDAADNFECALPYMIPDESEYGTGIF